MSRFRLPEAVQAIVGTQAYTVNGIGKSDSEVRIYRDYVLKIQPFQGETENEYAIVQWLNGRLPVPSVPAYCVENGMAYTLMSRIRGRMLCEREFIDAPETLIRLAAEGLKMLWGVDASRCPCTASRLTERLKAAADNVRHGLVDIADTEPETFGPNGFRDPEALLDWLVRNRPEEDIVFTHGDYCLPNIFAENGHISGFIDLGKAGPADRWQDIAIAIRSLGHNFEGKYTDGIKRFDFRPQMLTDALGIAFDEDKYRYYLLLDELF